MFNTSSRIPHGMRELKFATANLDRDSGISRIPHGMRELKYMITRPTPMGGRIPYGMRELKFDLRGRDFLMKVASLMGCVS